MAQRYDCLVGRPKNDGGTYWHRIGTAFEGKDGGMNVTLDSLPLQDKEGRCGFIIRAAKDLREASGTPRREPPQQRQAAPNGGSAAAVINDDIPFAPEWR